MPNSQPRPLPRPLSRYLTISSQAGNKLLTAVKKIRKSALEIFQKKNEREEESEIYSARKTKNTSNLFS